MNRILIEILLLNNGTYTFLSGVFVSLSINIFTGLCSEQAGFHEKINLYLASVAFFVTSAFLMLLAAKINKCQMYIADKRIEKRSERKDITRDFILGQKRIYMWWVIVAVIIISSIFGITMLLGYLLARGG